MKEIINMRHFGLKAISVRVPFVTFAFLLFTFAFANCPQAFGQVELAAPPIKALTKDEKAKLEAETDLKKRIKLALDLMEIRLKNAETLNAEENYVEMFTQLGFFHALMDNTLNFLERNNVGSGKVLNYYKRFEISLRGFIARLEVIRRELPPRYEYYVRSLVKAVRDARSRAVEPLFDNTVTPNQS